MAASLPPLLKPGKLSWTPATSQAFGGLRERFTLARNHSQLPIPLVVEVEAALSQRPGDAPKHSPCPCEDTNCLPQ